MGNFVTRYLASLFAALVLFASFDASAQIANPSFIQQGAGAKPRTFEDKAREAISVKDFGAKGDGVADDTAAIQAAWSVAKGSGRCLSIPEGYYLVTDTVITITNADRRSCIVGRPLLSSLWNKASANKPTIKLVGAQFWSISGLVLVGAATFPNEGIRTIKDGAGQRVAYGTLSDIVASTNGVGLHIQDANTLWVSGFSYWPSGGSAFGGTRDTNNAKTAILADGTGAVNEVYISGLNVSNLPTIANGGVAVKWNTSDLSSDIHIEDSELELGGRTTHRSVDFKNVYGFSIKKSYVENSSILLRNCRFGAVEVWGGATLNVTVGDGTSANACLGVVFRGIAGHTFSADSHNQGINSEDSSWQVYTNLSSLQRRLSVSDAVTGDLPDLLGKFGKWVDPPHSAGDFSSNSGTWVVESRDIFTYSYTIMGQTMFLAFHIASSTVTGSPSYLLLKVPAGKIIGRRVSCPISLEDNGTPALGRAYAIENDTFIRLYVSAGSVAWSPSSNKTTVSGVCTLSVSP